MKTITATVIDRRYKRKQIMSAVITLFLTSLPTLLGAGETLYSYVCGMKTALSQSAEWTSDHDAQWEAALVAAGLSPEWMG